MKKRQRGMTLVETAVALGIVSISAVGGLSYQYHAARQMRVATVMLSGMRIGQMLLEDWKGTGAVDDYDPTKLGLGFAKDKIGNDYIVTVDGQKYYVWLEHNDITTDDLSGVTLREIKCTIRWQASGMDKPLASTDPTSIFCTYVRTSQD
jgi:prepilin-type N-terminal cleavage/methylation domain-containing protein